MSKPLVAILDTCVLYPVLLRDALLRAAEAGIYQLRWTEEILRELRRDLVHHRGAPAERVDRMLAELAASFDDGKVSGHERHVPILRNDPKDRHVVAAAIEGGAELIVTANLKDFAPEVMPDGIRAISADEFLLELLERAPATMVDLVWLQATPGPHKQPGTADLEELSVALSDARVLSPKADEMVAQKARALAPLAVRQLATGLVSNDERMRAATAEKLRALGIDPERVEVAELNEDQILALLDRSRSTSQ